MSSSETSAKLSLRERQTRLTRELILRTVAELLEHGDARELTVPDVAEAAGLSLRTVYRYFATRDELLAAAADWIAENVFEGVGFPETIDELPVLFAEGAEIFDRHPNLARAIAVSRAGSQVRPSRRQQRLDALRRSLGEVTSNLKPAERRRAEAVFAHLDSLLAWLTMHDEFGLGGKEIGKAMEWAMKTLTDDLRHRDTAAGKTRGRRS
jgi:AcrR family transcriptional regulator